MRLILEIPVDLPEGATIREDPDSVGSGELRLLVGFGLADYDEQAIELTWAHECGLNATLREAVLALAPRDEEADKWQSELT